MMSRGGKGGKRESGGSRCRKRERGRRGKIVYGEAQLKTVFQFSSDDEEEEEEDEEEEEESDGEDERTPF